MFKLLLVDDEQFIREGIALILDWEEYGIEIIGEASNGQDAYEFVENNELDLVICDVRMPVMTGLEFIRKVRLIRPELKIIILSGYDDFNYVKEAIQLGVENYLLKPVDEIELKQTITQVTEKLEKEVNEISSYSHGKVVLKNNLMNRLSNQTISLKEFREKAEVAGIDILDCALQVAIININIPMEKSLITARKNLNVSEEDIYDVCMDIVPTNKDVVFVDDFGRVVIVFVEHEDCLTISYIQSVLISLNNTIQRLLGINPIITVGAKVHNYQQLFSSFEQATNIYEYAYIKQKEKVIFFEDIDQRKSGDVKSLNIEYEVIEQYIDSCDQNGLEAYVKSIFEDFKNSSYSYGFIYNVVIEIAVILFRKVRKEGGNVGAIFGEENELLRDVILKKSMNEVKIWLDDMIKHTFQYILEVSNSKYSGTVTDIIRYVDSYFYEEISLKTLSQHMHFHPAYLGRVFKKETGQVLTDYLNGVRIEKAKYLLMNSSKKASDIGVEVGFTNSNYFYAVFKKYTDLTPTQFRENS